MPQPSLARRPLFHLAALALLSTSAWAETLAVFVQPGAGDESSAVASHFQQDVLPEIEAWAADRGLDLKVLDASAGAPEAVGLTPLVVHVGPRGRSVFQGRYADVGKLEHFVRTSRVVPADGASTVREDVAVLEVGRAKVYAPLKITGLSGELPDDFDQSDYRRRAHEAFHAGLEQFKLLPEVEIGPSDRAFYMDVHGYRAADGRYFLSLDLYSQFHCLDPVFRQFDEPVSGDDFAAVFAAAARTLEAETLRQLKSTERGDGFDAVPASVPVASWDDLGLAIPESLIDAAAVADVELASSWRLDVGDGASPSLIFRFPPPLERYAGEVESFDAALQLESTDGELHIDGASGWVEADAGTVTFGEKDLDKAVHGKLKVGKFPASRFELRSASADESLAFGRMSRMSGSGVFTMLGMDVPLDVAAEVEPIIGEDGRPRLWVRARFGLDIDRPFRLKGPEGPPEASKHLIFFLDFQLRPAS